MNKKEVADQKLKKALSLYQEEWMEELSDYSGSEHQFSLLFEEKMQKLIRKQKKPYYGLVNTVGKRIAALVMLLLIIFSVTAVSVKSIRDPIYNFVIEIYEKFSEVIFQNNVSNELEINKIEKSLIPQYIPEGFTLASKEESDNMICFEYTDQDGNTIYYDQALLSTTMLIDTENTTTETILVNGQTGIYFCNKGYQTIIWSDNAYAYTLSSPLELGKEKLIRMAESVS